jgi:hypothetical protein
MGSRVTRRKYRESMDLILSQKRLRMYESVNSGEVLQSEDTP